LPAMAVPIDAEVPADAQIILHFDIEQFLKSDAVIKHFLPTIESIAGEKNNFYQVFRPILGDPLKDVSSLTIASTSKLDPEQMLFILRGKFPSDGQYQKAQRSVKGTDPKNIEIIHHVPKLPGRPAMFLRILDDNTIVLAGSKETI